MMRFAFLFAIASLLFPFFGFGNDDSAAVKYPVLQAHLETQIEKYPQNPGLQMIRSLLGHMGGETEVAEAVMKEYQVRGPELLWQWGYYMVRKQQPEIGLVYFEKARELAPRYPDPYIGQGGCLIMQEKYAEAVEVLEKALWMSPEDRRYWHLLAQAYDGSGQSEKMLKHSNEIEEIVKADGEILRLSRPWYHSKFPFESDLMNLGKLLTSKTQAAELHRELALFYDELEYQNQSCEAAVKAHKAHHPEAFIGLKSSCGKLYLKSQDQLNYEVNFFGKTHDQQLTLVEFGKGDILFEWQNTGIGPVRGSVQMETAALQSAKTFVHILQADQTMKMKESTAFWLPYDYFQSARAGKEISLNIEGEYQHFKLQSLEVLEAEIRGDYQPLPYLLLVSESGKELGVLDDPGNPLMVYMNFGKKVTLYSVEDGASRD